MTEPIRVLIADDHTIVRSGVRLLLNNESDIQVVGEALDGNEALAMAESLQPDVILMDISMPGMNGLEATRQVKARWPSTNILILTMHQTDEYFFETLQAGASGYVLKIAQPNELVNAVRVVGSGEVYLYPTLASHLVRDFLTKLAINSEESGPTLSAREKEILQLLAEGYSTREIADKLVVSTSTVHTHRNNLMVKLGLTNRHDLMLYAREHGLIRDF